MKSLAQFRDSLIEALALMALLVTCGSAHAASCTEDRLRDVRTIFNRAIRHDDLEAIAAILAEDVVLVTGTDSTPFIGREPQLALWRSDFDNPDRLIYLRETSEVRLSPLHPIAMEFGIWTGTAANGDEVGGDYSAKWRCAADRWVLEAEIFMTTRCDGAACP